MSSKLATRDPSLMVVFACFAVWMLGVGAYLIVDKTPETRILNRYTLIVSTVLFIVKMIGFGRRIFGEQSSHPSNGRSRAWLEDGLILLLVLWAIAFVIHLVTNPRNGLALLIFGVNALVLLVLHEAAVSVSRSRPHG